MKDQQSTREPELKNADFVAWRIRQGKKFIHDQQVRREYNLRARQRRETRH